MDTNKIITLLPEMAVLVVVIEEGSFSKAAEKLGVAPSSVSRSIARLEEALQQKLIERTTRKLRLSSNGEPVYNLCVDMLNSAKLASDAAFSDQDELAGEIRVAAPRAFSSQVLSPLILDFLQLHPKVSVHMVVEDHYIDPVGNEVDLVIHISDRPVEGLVARVLGRNQLVLCASPDYLATNGTPDTPAALAGHNCIRLGESSSDRKWSFHQGESVETVGVHGSLAVNHTKIRKDAVLRGMGISIFPNFSICKEVEAGRVVPLLQEWQLQGNYQGQILAQYPQSRFIPAQLKALVSHLQSHLS